CVSTIRARKWFGAHSEGENLLLSVAVTEDDKNNIELIELLHSGIQRLSQDDKAIINLWLDDRTYEEIASIMGLKRNTVATRIRRIKEKLANDLNDNL
ncbi:MAG: sigma-70 family RNA polymerase sigma factor, partial [Muribaculaceae bacterium]|nr:sigma-70 family RNA polymerase sigma factor [Muribaculaceae bacterium]